MSREDPKPGEYHSPVMIIDHVPTDEEAEGMAKAVSPIVEKCRELMRGHHPGVQGAVLAQLLAMWLAGHPKQIREVVLGQHNDMVREFVENVYGLPADQLRALVEQGMKREPGHG